MNIRDYMGKEVIEFYDNNIKPKIAKLVSIVRSCTNEDVNFIVYGGFVRDVIKKIPIDILLTKDVDLYINTFGKLESEDILKILHCFSDIDKYIDNSKVYELVEFEEAYVGLSPYPYDYPEDVTGRVKIGIDNTIFDISIDADDNGKYRANTDYRCNSLGFNFSDEQVYSRNEDSDVHECISDIQNNRLYAISVHKFEDWKYREEKMKMYGYS